MTTDGVGNDLESLLCFTSQEDCCDSLESQRLSMWLSPDDNIFSNDENEVFYEQRGPSILSLNRGSGEGAMQSGLYRCLIPDKGAIQITFVGLYPDSTTQGG